MLAVDANVIVRLITEDDPAQARRAARLFESNEIQVSRTVLLETARVLNASYGFRNGRVLDALEAIAGLPGVHVESARDVARAIELGRAGLDFADAMRLVESEAHVFVTSDEKLVRLARKVGLTGVKRL